MDCDKNLLKLPPQDIYPKYDYFFEPPLADLKDKNTYDETKARQNITGKEAKRMAFMLCRLSTAINDGLRHYKTKACHGTGNLNELYTVREDPTRW